MRPIILALLLPIVAGCAAGNTGAKFSVSHVAVGLPSLALPPTAPVVLPRACTADLLAAPLVEPPPQGGFPAVDTGAPNASALSVLEAQYLAWIRSEAVWGREGWARAALGRAACSS